MNWIYSIEIKIIELKRENISIVVKNVQQSINKPGHVVLPLQIIRKRFPTIFRAIANLQEMLLFRFQFNPQNLCKTAFLLTFSIKKLTFSYLNLKIISAIKNKIIKKKL